jgi:hypothetical protein
MVSMARIKMQMLEKDVNRIYLLKVNLLNDFTIAHRKPTLFKGGWVVDYRFYCEDKFVGTVNASQLHKYINGMEIEHAIDEED